MLYTLTRCIPSGGRMWGLEKLGACPAELVLPWRRLVDRPVHKNVHLNISFAALSALHRCRATAMVLPAQDYM